MVIRPSPGNNGYKYRKNSYAGIYQNKKEFDHVRATSNDKSLSKIERENISKQYSSRFESKSN